MEFSLCPEENHFTTKRSLRWEALRESTTHLGTNQIRSSIHSNIPHLHHSHVSWAFLS